VAERDALFAIAEVAIGLAGFSAVVVVLVRRSGGWEAASAFRLELLLLVALSTAFFGFLPVAVWFFEVGELTTWRLSSWLFAAWHVTGPIYGLRVRHRRLPEDARDQISQGLMLVGAALSAVFAVLLVLNATGWLFTPQVGPYFAALLVQLATGMINFLRMVLTRPSGSTAA
jgi:hypothetical protein